MQGNIPKSYECNFSREYTQNSGMLRRRYCSENLCQRRSHSRYEDSIFDIIRAHQLKMNPTKSFLGLASGKFHGFVVTSKEMHLDPEKVCSAQEMQPPRNLKELRGLQERLAYIRRFISNLSGRCQPFTKLTKKGVFIHLG